MTRPNVNFNNPFPDEYEQLMPSNLSPIDRFNWRKLKLGELIINGLVVVDDDGNCTFLSETSAEPVDTESSVETVAEALNDDMSVNTEEQVDDEDDEAVETVFSEVSERRSSVKKQQRTVKRSSKQISSSDEEECVRRLPRSVMDALRRLFPNGGRKVDLLSAAIYIVTRGDCEISDKAMELVEEYNDGDRLVSIDERLAALERISRRQLDMLQAVELCTCYNTYDRRYGAREARKGPSMTEFREKDNLDMLERLRAQARDQRKADDLAIGRQIYNQTKDKND